MGVYPTIEEAYYNQTKKKKEYIIQLANKYKEIMPKYVYDIIVSYEFDIRNDKNYVAWNTEKTTLLFRKYLGGK